MFTFLLLQTVVKLHGTVIQLLFKALHPIPQTLQTNDDFTNNVTKVFRHVLLTPKHAEKLNFY